MKSSRTEQDHEVEKLKLEQDLRKIQNQISDIITLNSEITGENKRKDSILHQKESFLSLLREKNGAEYQQLELDYNCLNENVDFEIKVRMERLMQLKYRNERYDAIQKENQSLESSINELEKKISDETSAHAEQLHQMNKLMRKTRMEMEATLRKSLVEMDLEYQQKAFMALSDQKKKVLLANSKMKDEIVLQTAGMSNLGVRLKMQEHGFRNIRREMTSLNTKSADIGVKLGQQTVSKSKVGKTLSELRADESSLIQAKETLVLELNRAPLIADIEHNLDECAEAVRRESVLADMWRHRLDRLLALDLDIKPTCPEELSGTYLLDQFPLTPVEGRGDDVFTASGSMLNATGALSSSNVATDGKPPKSSGGDMATNDADYSVRLSDIHAAVSSDKYLALALKPLRGKEGSLMKTVRGPAASDVAKALPASDSSAPSDTAPGSTTARKLQNMATWITLEILRLWRESEVVSSGDSRATREFEGRSELDQPTSNTNRRQPSTSSKHNESSHNVTSAEAGADEGEGSRSHRDTDRSATDRPEQLLRGCADSYSEEVDEEVDEEVEDYLDALAFDDDDNQPSHTDKSLDWLKKQQSRRVGPPDRIINGAGDIGGPSKAADPFTEIYDHIVPMYRFSEVVKLEPPLVKKTMRTSLISAGSNALLLPAVVNQRNRPSHHRSRGMSSSGTVGATSLTLTGASVLSTLSPPGTADTDYDQPPIYRNSPMGHSKILSHSQQLNSVEGKHRIGDPLIHRKMPMKAMR